MVYLFAGELGFKQVIIESDAQEVFKLFVSPNIHLSPLTHLLDACRNLLKKEWEIR